jgi:hypothetical protein
MTIVHKRLCHATQLRAEISVHDTSNLWELTLFWDWSDFPPSIFFFFMPAMQRNDTRLSFVGNWGLKQKTIPPFPPFKKMCVLNGVKNYQSQLKRKARPLYDPGRPGWAGPPTRQPLCLVHRGLILICLSVSPPSTLLAPHGTPRFGLVVSEEETLQGCGAKW